MNPSNDVEAAEYLERQLAQELLAELRERAAGLGIVAPPEQPGDELHFEGSLVERLDRVHALLDTLEQTQDVEPVTWETP